MGKKLNTREFVAISQIRTRLLPDQNSTAPKSHQIATSFSTLNFAPIPSRNKMAFLLNKTSLSALRLNSQNSDDAFALSRRGFHVEPGPREKALLAADPALKRFKSHKQGVRRLKVVGDVLTVVVVAGCCYEIYDRVVRREEARKKAT